MDKWKDGDTELEGETIAVLLDQEEYPSNVNNVAAISDRQICYVRKDRHELVNYRFEFFDMDDCEAIEYRDQPVYYRVVLAVIFFVLTAALAIAMALGYDFGAQDFRALIIGAIALLTFGFRFATSTHRHVINFEMPDQVLTWRSPPSDFNYKAPMAQAVRDFARERGLLREASAT